MAKIIVEMYLGKFSTYEEVAWKDPASERRRLLEDALTVLEVMEGRGVSVSEIYLKAYGRDRRHYSPGGIAEVYFKVLVSRPMISVHTLEGNYAQIGTETWSCADAMVGQIDELLRQAATGYLAAASAIEQVNVMLASGS